MKPEKVELDIQHQGLLLIVQKFLLPFVRRIIPEFVIGGGEALARWILSLGTEHHPLSDRGFRKESARLMGDSQLYVGGQ